MTPPDAPIHSVAANFSNAKAGGMPAASSDAKKHGGMPRASAPAGGAFISLAKFQDMLWYCIQNIAHRQLRSWLTVLGIVIGITSIVALIAIAQGLTGYVNNQLAQLGSRYVAIVPGDISSQASFSGDPTRPPQTGRLFINDKKRIEKIAGVDLVSSVVQARVDARFKDDAVSLSVTGVEPELFGQTNVLELSAGRFLADTDKRTAVAGWNFANKTIFKNEVQVGSVIRLGSDGEPYRVVGVLKKGMATQADNAFYLPIDDARHLAGDSISPNEVSAIRLTVKEGYDYNATVEQINNELMASHGVKEDEKDFSVVTSDFVAAQVGQITGLLTLFLGGIAGISLIVGIVGIANTMFMSVIERTREIGTLKAIGASKNDILGLFLLESGIIGLIGGSIGTLLGAIIAIGAAYAASAAGFNMPLSVTWELCTFAVVFSFVVGVASGFLPALRGAELSPIEALREE